jgi:hypothetical protein
MASVFAERWIAGLRVLYPTIPLLLTGTNPEQVARSLEDLWEEIRTVALVLKTNQDRLTGLLGEVHKTIFKD